LAIVPFTLIFIMSSHFNFIFPFINSGFFF
jgi:hypothetical protein